MAPSAGATAYLYHHVVLPPQLPQKDDHDAAHERSLFEVVIHALVDLKEKVKSGHKNTITSAIATVENLRDSRVTHGYVSEIQLQELLLKLMRCETDGAVPLEIKAQNADILVSGCAESLIFEFFELSPTIQAATQEGPLTRTFPDYASSVPIVKAANSDLRSSIAGTIAKMATQKAPGFQPQVRKDGTMIDEDRDTTHPGLVTDFLMNMIAALGETTHVKRIAKHTHEEILWNDVLNPWLRSPLWLLPRVSLQLLFVLQGKKTRSSSNLYKAFMLYMLARLLDSVR
ncbi:hypothetical protein PTMSG1_09133 [Pyrenophora teres f. maculata]|nr:hypothetical protein PTMSG1_09133 [Pyrenophora teres f. maculata]